MLFRIIHPTTRTISKIKRKHQRGPFFEDWISDFTGEGYPDKSISQVRRHIKMLMQYLPYRKRAPRSHSQDYKRGAGKSTILHSKRCRPYVGSSKRKAIFSTLSSFLKREPGFLLNNNFKNWLSRLPSAHRASYLGDRNLQNLSQTLRQKIFLNQKTPSLLLKIHPGRSI